MRKSTFSATVAIAATLSLPAQAEKFNCTFFGAGVPPSAGCPIDSSGPWTTCTHAFSGSLNATCKGGYNLIRCIIHAGPFPADVEQQPSASGASPLLPAPGMFAGGIAEASTRLLKVGYREGRGAPEFDAQCAR
jgi:hypothetical protein